jgi:hypothetical protein
MLTPDWKTIASVPITLMLWLFAVSDCQPEKFVQRTEATGLITVVGMIGLLKIMEATRSKGEQR